MQDILRTDISDLKPLPQWSFGLIGLIGDAAHATTPNLGQGGAMAVEDAPALADTFKKLGLNEAAWKRFEQLRRKGGLDGVNVVVHWEDLPSRESALSLSPQYRVEKDAGQRHAEAGSANLQSRIYFRPVLISPLLVIYALLTAGGSVSFP
jgi:2-polyprenyl-6-methoxyphenol hydroxylase-like FAD-dependent oxidoreductase